MAQSNLSGLSDEQVLASRQKHGRNVVHGKQQNRLWQVIKEIATEPLFIILVCTAVIYILLGEFSEAVIMIIALGFVSGISIYQENRSRSAVAGLKKLTAPLAKVIRNGITQQMDAEELVVDDLLVLEDGDKVPADAVLIRQNDFSVNESILTGESLPVLKETEGSNNNVFQGTLIMSGSCVARVTTIGKKTELGKISQSLEEIEISRTPLQKQIESFVKAMVAVGIVAFLIVWGINYLLSRDILHSLLQGLTLAMSVLPEEIPVAFSTFMALGAYHLYKQKVIARSPHTVETLGAATVICTDKTGTITENEMQLAVIYDFTADKEYDYTTGAPSFNPVLEYAMWASEPVPFDAMEKSIHAIYGLVALNDKRLTYTQIHEYPLGGKPPIMTHVFGNNTNERIIACKGGVEGVLNQTSLSIDQRDKILTITKQFASKGYRMLAVGRSDYSDQKYPVSQQEFEFQFLGLIGFYDPPKKNITETLQKFYKAGIEVKMITGDYAETAVAIAEQVGMKKGTGILTGDKVIEMNDRELREQVRKVTIFARMFPAAKLKVIEALKANGEVVAMTGDGVNDAPALKAAHIGIAMGKRGSDVAKSAASLVLVDDDLFNMTEAVALGRRIYENLKKAIQYIISIHIPIILIVTMPLVLMWDYINIFSPVHVIFLELIMGPTCSVIFENEPIEQDSMTRQPRKMSTTFFSMQELSMSIAQGLVITAVCLGLGYYFMQTGASETFVRTVIYTTLIFSNLFLTLVNRSFYYSILTTIRYKNVLIPLILSISLIVLFLSIYVHPLQRIFDFEILSPDKILLCLAVAFAGVVWVEIFKWIKRKNHRVK
ncbi:MAG: cation-translocating P-type ATPase [Cytophagales bacterium]|nr:cation-translocating P-type ATPase [Cytophagales bacterium]